MRPAHGGSGQTEQVPPVARRPGRAAAGVLAAQLTVAVLLAGYLLGLDEPLTPDAGLRQLDLISLNEQVPGVAGVSGRATLVAVPGDLTDPQCESELRRALSRRGKPTGLDLVFGLVVLARDIGQVGPAPPTVQVRADPEGELARSLALTPAQDGCRPGYALLDPVGRVRYRSYDPDWGSHAQEQEILLAEVAR